MTLADSCRAASPPSRKSRTQAVCMFYDFGGVSPNQPAPIRAAFEKMGQGAAIVIATDNGAGRRELADQINAIARETGREALKIIQDLPEGEGSDWNDCLTPITSRADAQPIDQQSLGADLRRLLRALRSIGASASGDDSG